MGMPVYKKKPKTHACPKFVYMYTPGHLEIISLRLKAISILGISPVWDVVWVLPEDLTMQ